MEDTNKIAEQLLEEQKQEIVIRQQQRKDKFIDDTIALNQLYQKHINDFVNEWNQMAQKRAQLDQKTITENKVIDGDKLNKA